MISQKNKKAAKEIELANNYNRSLIEAILDPLVTIGYDGKIKDVNQSTENITGSSYCVLILRSNLSYESLLLIFPSL